MGEFTATVAAWATRSEKVMLEIRNESAKRVVRAAQLSDDKGGRMRVDTGFLRSSGQMSLNGMPTGPIRPADDAIKDDPRYDYNVSPTVLIIAGAKLDNSLYFGWTANYAAYREWHDGFLRIAVQQWPSIVNKVVGELKTRYNQ